MVAGFRSTNEKLINHMSQYNRKDRFYQQAKKEGYPARSAYKLIELDKKFSILKPGRKIVDLGCAPGGWLKVAEEKLKTAGSIVGIDLLPLQYTPTSSVTFIQGNFLEAPQQEHIIQALGGPADWVLSDMSPNISGIKFKDLAASLEVCDAALQFSKKVLKKGGSLIVKIFPGPDLEPFKKELRLSFEKVSSLTPDATRKTSAEIYLIANFLK